MSFRNNQSQEPVRSTTLYSSSSKGSIYIPNKQITANSNTPMQYNPYGLRQQQINQTSRQTTMSKSSIIKPNDSIDVFMKDVKDKFFRLQKRLYEHDQQILELKSRSLTSASVDSLLTSDSQYKNQSKMMHQIERIRQQINSEYVRKDGIQFKLNRFELDMLDKFANKKQIVNKLEEIKDKTNHQLQRVFDGVRNELENSIHQVHDVNRVVFSRIQKDMSEMKNLIDDHKFQFDRLYQQVQLQGQPLYPGNKKCFGGIKMIKYQQALQKTGINGQSVQQIVVSECVYYLDRDGYLLDQSGYYLVNKMDQQIQLDPKQLSILRKNSILF